VRVFCERITACVRKQQFTHLDLHRRGLFGADGCISTVDQDSLIIYRAPLPPRIKPKDADFCHHASSHNVDHPRCFGYGSCTMHHDKQRCCFQAAVDIRRVQVSRGHHVERFCSSLKRETPMDCMHAEECHCFFDTYQGITRCSITTSRALMRAVRLASCTMTVEISSSSSSTARRGQQQH
jgi:hypothetical protein